MARKVLGSKRIENLPDDVKDTMTRLLSTGMGGYEVANWLQVQGYLRDIQRDSVYRALTRWMAAKREQNPEIFKVSEAIQTYLDVQLAGVDRQIKEIDEMTALIRKQLARIELDRALEMKSMKLIPALHKEFKLAADMLLKLADLKIKLGIYPSAPKMVAARLEIDDGRKTQKLLDLLLTGGIAGEIIDGEVMAPRQVKKLIRAGLLEAGDGASRGVGRE